MSKDKDGTTSKGDDRSDYEIGYKRPPRHTQFQPGRSGNAAGRPKGLSNLRTDVKRMLEVPVMVTERGRKRRISTQHGALLMLREKVMRGDRHAQKLLLDLAKLFNNEAEETVLSTLDVDDQEILNVFRAKIAGEVQRPDDQRSTAAGDHHPADHHRPDADDDQCGEVPCDPGAADKDSEQ
jgi:hypothetical protein